MSTTAVAAGLRADPVKKSFVGPLQAAHLFGNTKNIVDDL